MIYSSLFSSTLFYVSRALFPHATTEEGRLLYALQSSSLRTTERQVKVPTQDHQSLASAVHDELYEILKIFTFFSHLVTELQGYFVISGGRRRRLENSGRKTQELGKPDPFMRHEVFTRQGGICLLGL